MTYINSRSENLCIVSIVHALANWVLESSGKGGRAESGGILKPLLASAVHTKQARKKHGTPEEEERLVRLPHGLPAGFLPLEPLRPPAVREHVAADQHPRRRGMCGVRGCPVGA